MAKRGKKESPKQEEKREMTSEERARWIGEAKRTIRGYREGIRNIEGARVSYMDRTLLNKIDEIEKAIDEEKSEDKKRQIARGVIQRLLEEPTQEDLRNYAISVPHQIEIALELAAKTGDLNSASIQRRAKRKLEMYNDFKEDVGVQNANLNYETIKKIEDYLEKNPARTKTKMEKEGKKSWREIVKELKAIPEFNPGGEFRPGERSLLEAGTTGDLIAYNLWKKYNEGQISEKELDKEAAESYGKTRHSLGKEFMVEYANREIRRSRNQRDERGVRYYEQMKRDMEENWEDISSARDGSRYIKKRQKTLEQSAAAAAIIGLVGSILFSSLNLTGNAIGNLTQNSTSIIGAVLFVIGIAGCWFWMKGK